MLFDTLEKAYTRPANGGSNNATYSYTNPTIVGGQEKSFGEFCACIAKVRSKKLCVPQEREAVEKRLRTVYKTSLAETNGFAGGYTVPPEYAYGIMRDVAENSIFWPRAFVQPMTAREMMLPLPDPTQSIGTSQVTNMIGGIQMKWEISQKEAETDPAFLNVQLTANELTGYAVASNQLTQDYPGLDAFLRQLFTRAVGWYTDQAFFQGNGLGAPQGILNSAAAIGINRNTTNTVKLVDLATMMSRVLPSSWNHAIWAMSPGAAQQINQITSASGLIAYLPGDKDVGIIYGRPFVVTEKLPDLGSSGDVVLFDPSLYVVGFRDLLIDFSDEDPTSFLKNQSSWRIVWRGDGQSWIQKAVVGANQSSSTLSPIVYLVHV